MDSVEDPDRRFIVPLIGHAENYPPDWWEPSEYRDFYDESCVSVWINKNCLVA